MKTHFLFSTVILCLIMGVLQTEVNNIALCNPNYGTPQIGNFQTKNSSPLEIVRVEPHFLILRFRLPALEIQNIKQNEEFFTHIWFDGADWTTETGKPKLPTYSIPIGLPSSGTASPTLIHKQSSFKKIDLPLITNQIDDPNFQNSHQIAVPTNKNNLATLAKVSTLYPTELLKVIPVGFVRSQRVGALDIKPIQYISATQQLKITDEITFRIDFFGTPPVVPKTSSVNLRDSSTYEDMFQTMLINNTQASTWRLRQTHTLPLSIGSAPAAPTVERRRFKMSITASDMYQISYNNIKKVGITPETIDFDSIVMDTGGTPQGYYIFDENQNKILDPEDRIVFYARSISNKFTDTNIYWFNFAPNSSEVQVNPTEKDVISNISTRSAAPIRQDLIPPTAFLTKQRFELDVHHDSLNGNNVKSELADHYFWAGFRGRNIDASKRNFRIDIPEAVPRETIERNATVRVRLQGASYKGAAPHEARLELNGNKLGDSEEWKRQVAVTLTRDIPQKFIHHNVTNYLRIDSFDNNNTPEGSYDFYLDWYEIDYWRRFRVKDDRLAFNTRTDPQVSGPTLFNVTNLSSEKIDVYKLNQSGLSEKLVDGMVTRDGSTYQILFEDDVNGYSNYFAVSNNEYQSIGKLTEVPTSTLRNPTTQADYIVITHKTFLDTIQPLVEFRQSQGLSVKVVDIDEIYNEFSGGVFNPIAIQKFLKYAYETWQPPAPTYVLLVGDAHYDYKKVIVERYRRDTNFHGTYDLYPIFVPTYHGWAPASGETAMDQRFVNISGDDALPDMSIGRLSVQTAADLSVMVKKIIDYEQNPKIGPWQATIVQVADDETDNPSDEVFEISRDALVEEIIPFAYQTKQLYLRKLESPKLTTNLIIDAFNDGALVVEYAGHGGIHTWADEAIFHINDAENLENESLPFIVTTTCLNGQFDKPQQFGGHSLSEQFLLGKYGAIASLSASRLTYATANAEFDRDLFKSMFERTPISSQPGHQLKIPENPTIGKIVTDAKIKFITRANNPQWIFGAEQYTLFGDPATRLALPTHDIQVKLENTVLNSTKQIVILNNEVGRYDTNNVWWKAEDFSTEENLIVSSIFQNHFDDIHGNEITQRTQNRVWEGEYGTIRIEIPNTAVPGRGVVQLLAYDDTRTAIGGVEFWVKTPIVQQIIEVVDTKITHTLSIQALIVDDVNGGQGINDIYVVWDDTIDYTNHTYTMVKTNPPPGTELPEGGQWYKLQTLIPLPHGGRQIRYQLVVTDNTGLSVTHPSETKRSTVEIPEGPNIVVDTDGTSLPPIRYNFDEKSGKYILAADLINNGGRSVNLAIDVVFTEGNPDIEGDYIIDEGAIVLGIVTVNPADWEDGDTALQRTTAILRLDNNLTTGIHKIYVVADPETDSPVVVPIEEQVDGESNRKKYKGNIAEKNDFDNKRSVSFVVNEFFYKPSESMTAFSLDRVFDIDIPAAVATFEDERISLNISSSSPYTLTQPTLKFAPIPQVAALRRGLLRTGEDRSQQYEVSFRTSNVVLKKPVTVKLRFDISGLEDIVRENTPWQEGSKDYRSALIAEAEKLGIYTWQSTYEKWKRLPSEVSYVTGIEKPNSEDDSPIFQLDNYITPTQAENANKQPLSSDNINISFNLTPAATWVILFLDSTQYEVYKKEKHHVLFEKLDKLGYLDIPFREETYGLEFLIPEKWELTPELAEETTNVPFEFGDILIFETDNTGEGSVILKGSRNTNAGNGTAIITPRIGPKQEFAVGDWFIFFTSEQYYEIRDNAGAPVFLSNNIFVPGKVNETFYISQLGMEFLVTSSSEPFQFGDKIKFSSAQVGTITAQTTELAPFTLISSDDITPPTFNLWVDGLQTQVGSVIAPRPYISILLEDTTGIDLDSLIIRRGDHGKPLRPISDYVLRNQKNVHTVPIDYKPILFPGEYIFEIEVSDYNGNAIGGDTEKIQTRFSVVDMPDISPPVVEILVNDEILFGEESNKNSLLEGTNRILDQPHCKIQVTDDIALDDTLLSISFNQISLDETTRRYREFDAATWVFDAKVPENASFSFAPDLPNGTYMLQVSATDTSENTTDYEVVFTLDEAVTLTEVFNVPNPIHKGNTFFTYQLAQPPDNVTIKVYTVNGRLIRTIVDASARRGNNETLWDGRDETGIRCANGVYLYRVIAHTEDKNEEKIGKLAILR